MSRRSIFIALLIAVAVGVFLSPFASSLPDGLERVAEDKGFVEKGEGKQLLNSPIPDYQWPIFKNTKLATAASGGIGILMAFTLTYSIIWLLNHKTKSKLAPPRSTSNTNTLKPS